MKPSPLQFAREFEKLKSDLSRLPASDLKLLLLARFWEQLAPVAGKSAYESYLNDYRSLVIGLVQADALSDLTIDSLNRVRHVLRELVDVSGIDAAPTSLLIAALGVSLRVVTLLFYVGAYDDALSLCAKLEGVDDLALPTDSELRGLSPLDTLRTIYDKYRRDYPELGTMLQGILAQWEEDALAVEHDRVWCLFVDKDGKGNAATGRMRLLTGTVEQIDSKSKTTRGRQMSTSAPVEKVGTCGHVPDTRKPRRVGACLPPSGDLVAFDNQVKTPDDPFIGVAYDSLKAVRTALRSAGFAQRAQGSYRAFLSIDGSSRTFTGDSIGLAVALVAFTQLLKPEVMRQERFIASDIAVTGSIDADGRITPVNDDTLSAKIERAFFSHVRYVVVPEANLATARDTVKYLNKQYPRRKLRLVSATHLDDVLDDRNIIRAEKVCPLDYIVRQTVRFTRATKVQVPLLLMLLYALTCIIYPKTWVGFDWNPWTTEVNAERNTISALNRDGYRLWSRVIPCDLVPHEYVPSAAPVADLDGDGDNELLFMPFTKDSCEGRGHLFFFESDGQEKLRLNCAIPNQYPGDTAGVLYNNGGVRLANVNGHHKIITAVTQECPARSHIRIWSAQGDSVGWYINSGHAGYRRVFDLDGDGSDELLMLGFNNRMSRATLFALDADSSYGVSPPYDDSNLIGLADVQRGNQLMYMIFPLTDVGEVDLKTSYQSIGLNGLEIESSGMLKIPITESVVRTVEGNMLYYVDRSYRVTRVVVSDRLRKRRDVLTALGQLPPVDDWSAYQFHYRDLVTYWTDTGWVTEGQFRAAEAAATGHNRSN